MAERAMIDSGIILLKYWLEVSPEGQLPYEELPRARITLPKRRKPEDYLEPDRPLRWIPESF